MGAATARMAASLPQMVCGLLSSGRASAARRPSAVIYSTLPGSTNLCTSLLKHHNKQAELGSVGGAATPGAWLSSGPACQEERRSLRATLAGG